MDTKIIRLGLVDDHQIMLDGIKALLNGNKDIKVVFETIDPQNVANLITANGIDVLLTDIQMPHMNGYELAKIISTEHPEVKIIALSMSGQGSLVNKMIEECDISGYILKNVSRRELIECIKKVANGGVCFSDEVLEEILRDADAPKKPNPDDFNLTPREIEIIQLIEKEYSNKAIADTLYISQSTVETHRKNIFRKTKTNSLIGLIKFAYINKLI